MRTKALILTAAVVAAGVASSMAQSNVYSLNVVGYVNITLPANKFVMIENPLDTGNNVITNVFTDPNLPDNLLIFPFAAGTFGNAEQFIGGFGWAPGTTVLNPGSGFFALSPTTTNVTFVGSVVASNKTTMGAGFSLIGSAQPVVKALGDATTSPTNTLNFPAVDGDLVFEFITATGKYRDAVQYIGGFGWADPDSVFDTNGTIPAVGEGFFVFKSAPATWTQTFVVGP